MVLAVIHPGLVFVEVECLQFFVFRAIIFAKDMLENQSKALKIQMVA